MTDREQFETKVVPIMDRVQEELRRRQAEEARRFVRSPAYILAGGSGPDGGMGSQAVALDTLRVTGEWTSKTVEDYVEMVKAELRKEGVTVTAEMEQMMIDKMARDQMPRSSIDYILRKAAGNTLFGLPEEVRKTPLQREIEERGEKMYGPSAAEKGIGWGIGAAADFATLGGFSGGVASGLKFVGADLAVNTVIDTVDKVASGLKFVGADLAVNTVIDTVDKRQGKEVDVPKVILPGHEQEWIEANRQDREKDSPKEVEHTETIPEHVPEVIEGKEEIRKEDDRKQQQSTPEPAAEPQMPRQEQPRETTPEKTNTGGWQGILTGLGLNGLGDIGRNAGYILAMLPDMLVGMFTGKTQSLGLRDNLVPIASIMAGLFVRNPLLKMTLIGLGGANLLNKAGHEQLARQEGLQPQVRYRQYEDEQMNPRIRDAEVRGSTLIATMDGIPVTIALPDKVVDAYRQGALPLGKLANAVLERCDHLQQITDARERFEQESRSETRGITQR